MAGPVSVTTVNDLKSKPPNRTTVTIVVGIIVGALGFFVLGLNVGNGRLSFANLSSLNKNLPTQLNYSSVNQVYNDIRNQYDGSLTNSEVLNGLKSGLAQATGDPYTEYFSPSEAQQFNQELNNSFSGIGAELSQDSSGDLIIISPISGFPAAKAGLQPQDIISSINGTTTTGMSVDAAVNKIRGAAGTKVDLTILRNGTQLNFSITRANITLPSVTTQTLSGNIGYIAISQFTNDTSNLALQAAQKFKQANVKGIILDLRDNPGGLVSAAVNVSSLWLPSNDMVMQEKRGSTIVQTYYSTGNDILHGIPTVVLINGGSASASEITAGALHDNGLAYLIGTTSFGKGSVQQVDSLSGGAELKVTIAHWYRPDGQNINHKGITPDQTVSMGSQSSQATTDLQENAAISYLQSH